MSGMLIVGVGGPRQLHCFRLIFWTVSNVLLPLSVHITKFLPFLQGIYLMEFSLLAMGYSSRWAGQERSL